MGETSCLLAIAMITPVQNRLEEERAYLAYKLQSVVEGSQGRSSSGNLEAGIETGTMEEH